MTNIAELRLNNYLHYNGIECTVDLINGNGIIYVSGLDFYYYFNTTDLQPIHITEDWVLKLGFRFVHNMSKYGWYLSLGNNRVLSWCHGENIDLEFDCGDHEYNGTLFSFPCNKIHQLQNLYFTLTGCELTINK